MGQRTSSGGIFVTNDAPGPGAYKPINCNTSAKFSMKGKHYIGTTIVITPDGGHEKMTEANDRNVPGPGAYQAKTSSIYPSISTRFGKEPRPSMGAVGAEKMPAPNAYNSDAKSCVLRAAPAYGFGASKRNSKNDSEGPGPGAYPIKTIIGTETQGKSLAKRLEQQRTSNHFSPGPGAYSNKFSVSIYSSPSWRIGTSTRDDEEKLRMKTSNYPPPDSYNPCYKTVKERNASWSFGRSLRSELATTSKDTPAPGTY